MIGRAVSFPDRGGNSLKRAYFFAVVNLPSDEDLSRKISRFRRIWVPGTLIEGIRRAIFPDNRELRGVRP